MLGAPKFQWFHLFLFLFLFTLLMALLYYHELDEWQKDNHYIRSGYVGETRSFSACFRSLFFVHNETVNIYTHLVPALLVNVSILGYIAWLLPYHATYHGWEAWNLLFFGTAATVCLGLSSTFHCIKAHSFAVKKTGNQLDYFGIVVLITCSLISSVVFTFNDHYLVKTAFIAMFLALGAACTAVTLVPRFDTPEYRPTRSALFVAFGLSGTLPVVCGFWLYGAAEAAAASGLGWLALEGTFYITGAVMYAARFPERLVHVGDQAVRRAGPLDIVGHSHQIFHVMVVVAAFCHWRSLVVAYNYMHGK